MDIQEPENTSDLINDENNNCQYKNHLDEEKTERMIIVPDISSDEEYFCSSCSSNNESELISLDTRKLWHDIAHIIKCSYRETNREFTENHSTADLSKAKEYVQILTQSNAELLFNKIKSIVLEYVNEIRNQVLKRSQTCLKTSNDIQCFISYLLDEYNTFIQAAKNVSTIVSYLEEYYMKSFHLTWLLYNKHLYEKLVYMDKKIQHSMSLMIDLLQPSNEMNNDDYSPAEYTQLLNRFLAFDEEMSEIACVYKDCQIKMNLIKRNSLMKNRNQIGIIIKTSKKKKLCKKIQKNSKNSSTTNAVNIPLSNNCSTIPVISQQDSNGSSIGSIGISGKESSSISSFDEYLLDNNTLSLNYSKEEIENKDERLFSNISEDKQIISNEKSKSIRRKENINSSKTSLTSDLILSSKPPSKLQADFRPLTIPLLTKTDIPTCPSLLSAKIQSVSFTAGTFGSITTTTESSNQKRLNLNLSRKHDSTIPLNNLDQLLRQTTSNSLDENTSDFCCCDLFSDSNSSTPTSCIACMSLGNSSTITCSFNQREIERKERLKIKLTKRIIQNSDEQINLSNENKSILKLSGDNNIDDLVRFIDGNETNTTEIRTKKNKKKKDKKQNKTITIENSSQISSKQKQKSKLKIQQQEKQIDQSSTPPLASPPPPPPPIEEKTKSNPIKIDPSSENPISPEEGGEVNWITISRKQSKHKSTPVPVVPPNNNNVKQKRQQTKVKTKPIAQQKLIPETIINSNKQQTTITTTTAPPTHVQNSVKNQNSQKQQQQQKTETLSVWNNHEQQSQVSSSSSSSTLLATAPAFVPSSSLLIPNKTDDILSLEQQPSSSSSSSLYWDPNGYLFPPGPVQRPTSSFSPAPGPRCIRRPSPEPSTSFPAYSPMNYTINNSTTTWNNNTSKKDSNETQWKYPYEEEQQQLQTSIIPNDFPLYDPFNSGAGITIPPSTLITNEFEGIHIPQNNDIDEMDALDKEIEDFKKYYIDNISLDSCEKI